MEKIKLKVVPPDLEGIVSRIGREGGRALLIGGGVIDTLTRRPVKDWDVEVYGISGEVLEELLSSFGTVSLVGKAFGVYKLRVGEEDYDFSLPRRDNKSGVSHRDFTVEIDPSMTPREAGRRRDLTINSMYLDLHTGKLVDPFGGMGDLEKGVIRATDPATFVEDPLRVLRIMQLLPRKGAEVSPNTLQLCRSIIEEFEHLPKERVFEEWRKLLLKAKTPSLGLEFLRESGWLSHFPELEALIGCEQNPEWHPEGDVWNHTLMVLDNAATLRAEVPEDWRLAYMLGMLLHDVGKPPTTTPDLRSPGHAEAGVDIAERFMRRLTDEKVLIQRVLDIVRLHMRPGELHRTEASERSWKRLKREMRLDILGFVCKADSAGRTGRSLSDPHSPSELCWRWHEILGVDPIKPLVQGRDLIAIGLRPGPNFKVLLDAAMEMQLDGKGREAILLNLLSRIN